MKKGDRVRFRLRRGAGCYGLSWFAGEVVGIEADGRVRVVAIASTLRGKMFTVAPGEVKPGGQSAKARAARPGIFDG